MSKRLLPSISENLEGWISTTCLRLSEFDSHASLRAVFVVDRIARLRDTLPEKDNKTARVEATLRLLGEEDLLLDFLRVLANRYSVQTWNGDALRQIIAVLERT